MAALHAILGQVEEGQGQVVGIVGEPGMGKTRLLYEFRQSIEPHRVMYVEGHCQSYANAVPYVPLRELLRQICGITELDNAEAIDIKVYTTLQQLNIDSEEGVPFLRHFLGLPAASDRLSLLAPEAVKLRTFSLLRQVSLASSQQRPLLIVVENLHWIDPSSEAYLTSLVEVLVRRSPPPPHHFSPWLSAALDGEVVCHSDCLATPDVPRQLDVMRGILSPAAFPGGDHPTDSRQSGGKPVFPRGAGPGSP